MAHTSARPYRGVKPADRRAQRRARLLDAGLAILGSESRPEPLTVRGLCRQANISARYFYESFSDRDDFVGSVYDWVIADLAATTQAAVAAVAEAPPAEQARAGIANVVRSVAGDARVGRLFFSADLADAVVVRKRGESSAILARLFAQHLGAAVKLPETDENIRASAVFAVGGVGQTLSAWLAGELKLTREQLIDQLTALVDELGDPALYSPGAASAHRD